MWQINRARFLSDQTLGQARIQRKECIHCTKCTERPRMDVQMTILGVLWHFAARVGLVRLQLCSKFTLRNTGKLSHVFPASFSSHVSRPRYLHGKVWNSRSRTHIAKASRHWKSLYKCESDRIRVSEPEQEMGIQWMMNTRQCTYVHMNMWNQDTN